MWHYLYTLVAGISIPGFPEHAVSVQYATEHRCGVVVRGPGLSDAISGTDPLRDNLPLLVRARKALRYTLPLQSCAFRAFTVRQPLQLYTLDVHYSGLQKASFPLYVYSV